MLFFKYRWIFSWRNIRVLIPEIGKEKFEQLVARIKALHKETSKLADSFSYQKDYSKIKAIIDEISQPEVTQPNF